MPVITADAIVQMMKPGQLYKPAKIAAHYNVGAASLKHVLIELENAGRLQSEMHMSLRHWKLPVTKSEPIHPAKLARSGRSNMPNYSRAQELVAEARAIPSKHV